MLIDFFLSLKKAGLPVSISEYLMLCEALDKQAIDYNVDDFYLLSRACLVKNEAHFDRFDQAFGAYFKGIENLSAALNAVQVQTIPEEWLRKLAEGVLSDEDKAKVEALGGWDALMETLRKRLEEQKERHQGGSKWIGTAGTSPFGAYGFNPEGIRIGQEGSRNRSAVKVWDKREFRDYDGDVEIGVRNIAVALRRLRKFARQGAEDEFDLDNTIAATARNAGFLDVHMRPERRNRVKVLLMMDVGGSMDDYIRQVEELFTAAKAQFKHLELFYFHNFIYESVWRSNRMRYSDRMNTVDILNKYGHDYKLIIVGDATMSPYEILQPGGSVEHFNEETGAVWLKRLTDAYKRAAWINPTPANHWDFTHSIKISRQLMEERMFPLTVTGLEKAIACLN
jgi:uncharacterized protein